MIYRQADAKGGAATGLAFDFDLAVMLRNDLLDDREAEAGAAPLLGRVHRLKDQI